MYRAVFIDALGTMLRLQPPWERIDPGLVAGLPPERVRAGFEAEIAYYAERIAEGPTPERLADLRRRCAAVLSSELGREIGVEAMMEAIRFEPFSDVAPALADLRGLGLKLVCVSNWDCSLAEVLEELALAPLLDGVVTSAVAGASKPDPAIFEPALAIAGCAPGRALHVGDSPADHEAAAAAGIDVLLIDRERGGEGRITSLTQIRDHLRSGQ